MSEPRTLDAWTLWKARFKIDDYIVLVTEDDKMYRGRLESENDDSCTIECRGRHKEFPWDQIRFVCQDGFPVSKLLGADGSPSIEYEDNVAGMMRDVFKHSRTIQQPAIRQVVFGDPFLVENVSAQLVNSGNIDYDLYEETVLMESRDGAAGMLWDFQGVFFLDVG